MTPAVFDEIQQDDLAMAVARALTVANGAAVAYGVNPAGSLVTITEESSLPERLWRIHYGPRDFKQRRGGDLIVLVEERAGVVRRIIRGQ